MMKRSLIKRLIDTAILVLMVGFFASTACGQGWNWNQKTVYERHQELLRQQNGPSPSPVVRGQMGSSGYSTPSLPSSSPSYTPATNSSYPATSAPSYQPNYYSSGTGTTPATNNNYAGTAPASSGGYTAASTSKPYGDERYPSLLPGTGPPPVTGDPAGQGGFMPNWGGAAGGSIVAPDPNGGSSFGPTFVNGPLATDIIVTAPETQTGRLMFGVGVNSDAGLVGSIVLEEQNFDWKRLPRSFEDIRDATAWRGAGQYFRIEAVPGTEVQRYMVTFQEPYLMGSKVSLGLSGNYFTRIYRDWSEDRIGGSVQLGYHLTHALTSSIGFRGARVDVYDIANPAPQELIDAAGRNALYGFQVKLAHDTRDSTFMPTEGHLIEVGAEQVVGTYKYPRIDLDMRQYFMVKQRPDESGRHVVSLSYRVGWTGDDTPIYDNYFAGGFSTIRGFDYRGASPCDAATGVFVGGHFQMLASAEYLFPITADDMLRGVVFCDTGTVERTIDKWTDKYRIAPGFGLRITVPAMGPAPIALDFAFPIVKEDSDWTETFSFFVGMTR